MAAIAPQPKLQFFDANGNPLAGGKLYSYAAGTTTPLATYTDSTGGSANTNPIILDSRGEASVWLGSALYKLRLDSATNVNIWTVDNIGGAATLAELAASGGSALIGFLQSGTSAVSRTVQSKLRDVISVKDFGAVGDGSANDTSAITAALTAAAGKALYFPPGSYSINGALSVSANTYVYGYLATVTQSTAGGVNAFTIAGDNVTIDGLKIVGPNSGAGSAVRGDAYNNPTVKNCQVQNWLYGIQLRGCANWTVTDNRLWGGTYDSGSSSDIFIYGSTTTPSNRGICSRNFCLSNNDNGISVATNAGDRETTISENVVYPLQSDGVTPLADANNRRRYGIICSYNGTVNTRAAVVGNIIRDVPYSGIYMNAATLPAGDVSITGNLVARCGFGTLYPTDASLRAGIWCNGGADVISSNVVIDCTTTGIKIAPDYAYSSTNQPRAVISSNNVARTTGIGIHLTNKPHGYLVSSNRVINSTAEAIYYETSSADGGNCHFVANHIDTNTTNKGGITVANTSGGYGCSVVGNRINGTDNTTNSEFNSGIWFNGTVHCMSNAIIKYHRGINCATSLARTVTLQCSGNAITNCAYGVNAAGDGPWVVGHNTYDTVTTHVNGSAYQGVLLVGQGIAGTIHTQNNAAPTAGTWAQGDHVARQNQTVGQAKGWFCTVAGTPGTWVSEGNL